MLLTTGQLLKKHSIVPSKKYGQNFIFDKTLCDKILKYTGKINDNFVLEVGPGPACLTRSILSQLPTKLVAIELDKQFVPLLQEIQNIYPNLDVYYGDALKFEIATLVHSFKFNQNNKIKIISNLPYNIGNILLLKWLKNIQYISSMTLMLQKEVVDRIISHPDTKSYGRLSVMAQIFCKVEKCFDVSPKAFYPKPSISSSVVTLIPYTLDVISDILKMKNLDYKTYYALMTQVEKITYNAFSNRRKMIKSSLKHINNDIELILESLNIDTNLRAENLSPQNYLYLAKYTYNI